MMHVLWTVLGTHEDERALEESVNLTAEVSETGISTTKTFKGS